MYTATSTFSRRPFDDAFHTLDRVIAATAKFLPGYLGEESWENPAKGPISNVYCRESIQVVIAQVVDSHGDGRIDHRLA